MRNSKVKGFTLIELIVVIAIIGVLAAILVPSMIGYVSKSKLATANSNAKLAYTNTATYATDCEVAGYTLATGTTSFWLTGGTNGQAYSKTGSNLKEALESLMGGTANSGMVKVSIASTGSPSGTLWAKTAADQYVGGYPTEKTEKISAKITGATIDTESSMANATA